MKINWKKIVGPAVGILVAVSMSLLLNKPKDEDHADEEVIDVSDEPVYTVHENVFK